MSDDRLCPECGAHVPEGSGNEPCPGCLMRLGMESWTERHRNGTDQDAAATATLRRAGRFVVPEPAQLVEVFPQLEILELVGAGGMGAVYKARQKNLDRLVALKILPTEIGADPAFAERFAREARALARLNHPNIVSVYEYGQTEGQYFLVMEYVDGVNLRHLVGDQRREPAQVLGLVAQICDALQFAHDEGVVHRDIKPENILVDSRGRAKIADFGLAKLLDPSATDVTLTQARQTMGTPYYMAPEQMEGSTSVDHRADLYSLGVVLYELLTGELPLGRYPLPSAAVQVDVRMDEIVLRALQREPERRYQRASEIKTAIQHVSDTPLRSEVQQRGESESRVTSEPGVDGARSLYTESQVSQSQPNESVHIGRELRRGGASVQGPSEASSVPRFSRKAIAGALWAPLFLLVIAAIAPAFLVETVVELPSGQQLPGKPTLLMLVVGGIALLVGGSAIFGTTILGLLAIRDIRHSQGRIVGMPLALADALLFPLLLLDLLIAGASMMVAIASGAELLVAVFAPVALVVCLIVDGLVILWAWRAVHAPTALGTSTTLDLPAAAALPSKPLGKSPAKDSRVGRVGKRSPLVILPAGVLVLVILLGSVLAMRIANRPSDTVLLMSAIRAGDTVAAESLLESHPELIEARDDEQLTPLNWAALRGNVSLVRYLANRGAEIDTVDVYRETPLFKAAGMGHHAVAGVLLMEGAAVDHVNEDGRTPLMLAAGRGDLPTVQLLVEYGADFNHVDAAGESVLIRAVAGGHRRVTQFLLAKGADVQHRDDRGQGVLQYALTESMYQWLKDAGAPMGPPEWFREGYAMALAGRYAEAAELLERVRADAEPLTTIFARVNGWQYELFEPQLIVSLMVAECYARGGEAERAREVLKEFQKVWPTGMNIALYERRQESPGHKVVEQYQLDWSIFQQFRESPDRMPKLTLNRHEVVNENGQHTRVSSSLVSVAGMFHR